MEHYPIYRMTGLCSWLSKEVAEEIHDVVYRMVKPRIPQIMTDPESWLEYFSL